MEKSVVELLDGIWWWWWFEDDKVGEKHFNPLNAELNPICHSLILLWDLTFMGTCIVSIFQYIYIYIYIYPNPTRCNVTQFIYTWKLLYMFRVVHPPIIRSAYNCIYSIWYLSHRYCYLRVGTGLSVLWVVYASSVWMDVLRATVYLNSLLLHFIGWDEFCEIKFDTWNVSFSSSLWYRVCC
jgi:hypothetical protein